MAEYIDEYIRKNDVYNLKNAFSSLIKEESTKHDGIEWVIYNRASESALNMIERGVQEIPAADVAPVVHAKWEHTHTSESYFNECWRCSACGFDDTEGFVFEFCPHCGAKMDLEESK